MVLITYFINFYQIKGKKFDFNPHVITGAKKVLETVFVNVQ